MSAIQRAIFVSSRLVFGAFFLCTSFYCLVAYVPFTYQQVIEFNIVGWVGVFAAWHPYLYWVAFVCGLISLMEDFDGRSRWLAVAFATGGAGFGAWLLLNPLLATLHNDVRSLYWAVAVLLPLYWVAIIDHVGHLDALEWLDPDPGEDSRVLRAGLLSAGFVAATYLIIGHLRASSGTSAGLSSTDQALAAVWVVSGHLVVFMLLCAAIALARGIAGFFRVAGRAEFVLCNVVGLIFATFVLKTVVLAGLSIAGSLGTALALAYAGSMVAFASGVGVRVAGANERALRSGLEAALMVVTPLRPRSALIRGVALVVLGVLASLAAINSAKLDWNYLFQKLVAVMVWGLCFSIAYARPSGDAQDASPGDELADAPRATIGRFAVLFVVPLAVLVAYRTLEARPGLVSGVVPGATANVAGTLERYAGYDASFKLIRDTLRPRAVATDVETDSDSGDYYAFLQKNTNISRTIKIAPTDVRLVPELAASGASRPHIFMIVIDSLRQDYVAPYNPAVTFTPAIARFASESVVFKNAYTRYGATGLSVPSIWVGGLLPHQQYVTPFAPMNALQKLLKAEGYQSFLSMDNILDTIVTRGSDVVELDRGVAGKDFELCRSLGELTDKVLQRGSDPRPIFAYTQPQNIHIAAITREGATVADGQSYPGFYAPYASRLRRIDACFGEFVTSLKQQGLYDNSVIIFTSDHGDSLGEDGRWGHAYTLFPEILRIPLIVHLPAGARPAVNQSTPSFLTDITPTLYELLGHKPTLTHELFGRSLVADATAAKPASGREQYLVASSYGPTYGILGANGRSLYLVDATNYRDYYFDLGADPTGRDNVITPALRREYEPVVRRGVSSIASFYKIPDLR